MPPSLTAALERHSNLPRIDINALTGPPASLLDALRLVPDPRSRRGIRYPFSWPLAVCICAALPGDSSLRRIGECATRLARGARANAPAATTIQRLLQRVDPDLLDQALAAGAATRATGAGKRHRRQRTAQRPAATTGTHHLLAATDHTTGTVLGQVNVLAKTNEITQLPLLLEQLQEQNTDPSREGS